MILQIFPWSFCSFQDVCRQIFVQVSRSCRMIFVKFIIQLLQIYTAVALLFSKYRGEPSILFCTKDGLSSLGISVRKAWTFQTKKLVEQ